MNQIDTENSYLDEVKVNTNAYPWTCDEVY